MRYPDAPHRSELDGVALVRELHVYGPLVDVVQPQARQWQHRGYREELLATGATWGRGAWAVSQDLVLKKKTWKISPGDCYCRVRVLSSKRDIKLETYMKWMKTVE